MCNRYALEGSFYDAAGNYKATFVGDVDIKGDFFPCDLAPGLIRNQDGDRELHPMQFAFAPPGSDEPYRTKFKCNNARIEEATNKKKWPFFGAIRSARCILPLNRFQEPCYWGETEGTAVDFHRPDNALLHAAGIYKVWTSRDKQRQLYTMSMLMRPAVGYVLEHGHHRSPIFVRESVIDDWLNPDEFEAEAAVQVLRDSLENSELIHTHHRDMAKGWNVGWLLTLRSVMSRRRRWKLVGLRLGFRSSRIPAAVIPTETR